MPPLTLEVLLHYAVAAGTAGYAGWMHWELWRTRRWPTVPARVVPLSPELKLHPGGHPRPDYAIAYSVAGREFAHAVRIAHQVLVNRATVWKSPAIPLEFQIRLHPRDPARYSLLHVHSKRALWAATAICIGITAFALWRVSTIPG